jgi:hypothetical protein
MPPRSGDEPIGDLAKAYHVLLNLLLRDVIRTDDARQSEGDFRSERDLTIVGIDLLRFAAAFFATFFAAPAIFWCAATARTKKDRKIPIHGAVPRADRARSSQFVIRSTPSFTSSATRAGLSRKSLIPVFLVTRRRSRS